MSLKDQINSELAKGSGFRVTDDTAKNISDICKCDNPTTIANIIQGITSPPQNRK